MEEDEGTTGCRYDWSSCIEYRLPAGARYALVSLLIIEIVVAVALSILIVVALTIPLSVQLKNGTFRKSAAQLRRSRRGGEYPYSTYNLYLVYLAIVDLAWMLPTLATLDLKTYPSCFEIVPYSMRKIWDITIAPYMIANFWLNAIIAHQVLLLLQRTHRAQRITQPSLTTVNLQCGGLILSCIAYRVLRWYFPNYGIELIVSAILLLTPIAYVIGVTILVKCKGYIPAAKDSSAPRDRAIRGLAVYFFRVCAAFVAIWFPWWILWYIGTFAFKGETTCPGIGQQLYYFFTDCILIFLNPILTFYMILAKDDVKKYIRDLLGTCKLSYVFGCCCCESEKKDREIPVGANRVSTSILTSSNVTADSTDPEISNERRSRNSFVLLGYSFCEIDDDENDDDDDDSDDDDDDNGDDNGDTNAVTRHVNTDINTDVNTDVKRCVDIGTSACGNSGNDTVS